MDVQEAQQEQSEPKIQLLGKKVQLLCRDMS